MTVAYLIFGVVCLLWRNKAHGLVCTPITATNTTQYIYSHSTYGDRPYSNNYKACWIITTQTSSKIAGIKRIYFELENGTSSCSNDSLKVYKSNTESGTSINFCGVNIFTQLYSSSRYMYLKFTTNKRYVYAGFKLAVKEFDKELYNYKYWKSSYYQYSTNSSKKDDAGLSDGAIAGIAIGSLLGFGFMIWLCNNHKHKNNAATQPQSQPPISQQSGATTSSTSSPSTTTQPAVAVTPQGGYGFKPTMIPPDRTLSPPPAYSELFGDLQPEPTRTDVNEPTMMTQPEPTITMAQPDPSRMVML